MEGLLSEGVTANVVLFTRHGYEETRIKSFLNDFVSSWQKRTIGANHLSSYRKAFNLTRGAAQDS